MSMIDSEYTPYIPDEEIAEILLEYEQRFSNVRMYDRLFSELQGDDKFFCTYLHDGFRICSFDMIDTFIGKHLSSRYHERSSNSIEQRQCKNIHCGQLFYPRKREHVYQQYCSRQCSPRKGRKRICPSFRNCLYKECQKEFQPKHIKHVYCSHVCSNRGNGKQRTQLFIEKRQEEGKQLDGQLLNRNCLVCQTTIKVKSLVGRARYKMYCSKRCKSHVMNSKYYNKCQKIKMENKC